MYIYIYIYLCCHVAVREAKNMCFRIDLPGQKRAVEREFGPRLSLN